LRPKGYERVRDRYPEQFTLIERLPNTVGEDIFLGYVPTSVREQAATRPGSRPAGK
jgi:hypothetical protein